MTLLWKNPSPIHVFNRYPLEGDYYTMVQGISLVTLVWTNGLVTYSIDFRIYHTDSDAITNNDHFADMLKEAKNRQFNPDYVLFDSW